MFVAASKILLRSHDIVLLGKASAGNKGNSLMFWLLPRAKI